MKKFTFGPIPSRRLGFSLGVDIIPRKFCSFDCIYCQVGKTTNQEVQRKSFFDVDEIVDEIDSVCRSGKQIDVITFSGSGEPTLNADLGRIIEAVKNKIDFPVSVITNSSLLNDEDVRNDLKSADIVLPSLDAASEDIFHYINRPHSIIEIGSIIDGLKKFRNQYKGNIWLEIMLIKDINDDTEELENLKDVVSYIEVDKIQLNTVTRPPADKTAKQINQTELQKISRYFGDNCEIVCAFQTDRSVKGEMEHEEAITDMLKRRALSLDDIVAVTGLPIHKAKNTLRTLENSGKIKSFHFGDTLFFMSDE